MWLVTTVLDSTGLGLLSDSYVPGAVLRASQVLVRQFPKHSIYATTTPRAGYSYCS